MIHRLYSATTGDAAVSFIVPEDAKIEAVRWVVYAVTITDGGSLRAELSFAAANQHILNDVVNVIDSVAMGFEILTSGGLPAQINDYHEIPGGVPIEAGEKLYLHNSFTLCSGVVQLYLYTDARRANKTSFRRR